MNLSERTWDREGLAAAIACEDAAFDAALREEAYRVKVANNGPEVYLRGLIEISNSCVIQRIATGREPLPIDSMRLAQAGTEPDAEELAAWETSDSLLRAQVEMIDASHLSAPATQPVEALQGLKFHKPLKGTIKEGFSRTGSHPYIEVSAPSGTQVSAILDGRVVSAEWNELEGCTMKIQHEGDVTSFYRHADRLLKSVGEQVKAGTAVAVVGETGELSQALIQLELRYKNQPVDPALYIPF